MQVSIHNLSREVIFLKEPVFYAAGNTAALQFAKKNLQQKGFCFADTPNASVTHLLLDVPAFAPDGTLRDGGKIEPILSCLSPNIKIYGGFLSKGPLEGYDKTDLLEDAGYVAENARITAYCAAGLAAEKLPVTLYECPVLIIGWGRIGKCLARLLQAMGARVSVYARKEKDRAMLSALGYDLGDLSYGLCRYRAIFNTAPFMVLPKENAQYCREDCLKIELASVPGIEADDVIPAGGLPSKLAPESSGQLIAQTILRLKGV